MGNDAVILEGAEKIKLPDVMRLMKMTYWAENRSPEQVEKSMRHSACFGVYLKGEEKLIGFARVISDFATTYFLNDVVIDSAYRGQGYGTALVRYIVEKPEYKDLRGVLLTRDAHSLYSKFGFELLNDRAMVRARLC